MLIHISLVVLLSSIDYILIFPRNERLTRVWSYNVAHHLAHFLDQQSHFLSDLSNLLSSIFFKLFQVSAQVT